MAVDGEFLRPWFEALRGRVTAYTGASAHVDSDCVRIGREQRDDFWLRVDHHFDMAATATEQRAALRRLREAVLLTSHFATVDYEGYAQWMRDIVGLELPSFFEPAVDKLPNRYTFVLDDTYYKEVLDEDEISALLGSKANTEYSDAFVHDLELVQALLSTHRGIEWREVEPVPLLLHVAVSVPNMSSIVMSAQRRVQRCRDGKTSVGGLGLGSLFDVVALEVEAYRLFRDFTMLQTWPVASMLDCGVALEHAVLPCNPFIGDDTDMYKDPTMVDMKELVQDAVQVGNVRHLVVDWGSTHYFPRLCSALRSARAVQTLELVSSDDEAEEVSGTSEKVRMNAWRWLAFALFSSASSSSVETLVINGDELWPDDVDAIREIVESTDPLRQLAQSFESDATQDADQWTYTERDTRPRVTFQPETSVRLHNGHDGSSEWYKEDDYDECGSWLGHGDERRKGVDLMWTGDVVRQRDATNNAAIVFVEGVGFCQLGSQERTVVAGTTATPTASNASRSSSFHSLVIKYDDKPYLTMDALPSLLEIIGSRLRGLSIQVPRVQEKLLERIFALCPHLESLAINGATLSSLRVFTLAFDTFQLPLSSLDLGVLTAMPASGFYNALPSLSSRNSALTRLRVGFQPVSDEESDEDSGLEAMLRQFLDNNRSLTHVALVAASDAQLVTIRRVCEAYHGQIMMCPRRLALLGSLRRLAHTNKQQSELNAHVVGLIFAFGLPPPPRRSVTWELDPPTDDVWSSDSDSDEAPVVE